ncbi:hypothetical protein [Haloferula rosea]|uniref:Uncharacterized protein n=1 Tax=Haloferula rosea TaxID=490093 RepID=A0A934VHI8_9BACT|nr:hypothetical protein [Haloferula rosea]MBK1828710.1 hypothetical protein [Haloferula rosea]
MIYLTPAQINEYYGTRIGGLKRGRFNAEDKSQHSETGFKYEFGYHKGFCVYAIIQKKSGKRISLEEAEGMRRLNGNGEWKLNTPLNPDKHAEKLKELLDDEGVNLGYFYQRTEQDKKSANFICVHQKRRHQLVIYHPIWRPDLDKVASSPI